MIAPGSRVTLQAAGTAGGWSPWAAAYPSQVREAIVDELLAQGFSSPTVAITSALDSSVVRHSFPYRADIAVTTQAAVLDQGVITIEVKSAVERATRGAADVSNRTAGDAALPLPSGFELPTVPEINVSLGLIAVILLAAIYLVKKA